MEGDKKPNRGGCTDCHMAEAVIVVNEKVVLCPRCWMDRYQEPIDKWTTGKEKEKPNDS